MSDILTRDEILAADDIQSEVVEVPEWGGSVIVRGLTGTERDAFERTIISNVDGKGPAKSDLRNFRAKLATWSMVNEDGKRLFNQADVIELGQKSAAALQRVFNVAQRLSGLSEEDIEELTKNSEELQSDGSGFD